MFFWEYICPGAFVHLGKFLNKTVATLVIFEHDLIRSMMQDVLRKNGFNARGAKNSKDAISFIEAEKFDWIIMPYFPNERLTAMHILGLGIRNPHWRSIRMSLLVGERAGDCSDADIADAMKYGCLSYMRGPFTQESFDRDIKQLKERMLAHGFLSDLVSATYLRSIAIDLPLKEAITKMEAAIVNLYPGDFSILMESAESCRNVGSFEEALILCSQARLLEDPKTTVAEKKYNDVLDDIKKSGVELGRVLTSKDILGFDNAVIIDSDTTVSGMISRSLKAVGVAEINIFSDGQEFMDWLGDNEPDVIIMEWRIQKVSAAKILQRVSARPNKNPPQFVVVSSSIAQADLPMLKEFGVGSVVEKPFGKLALMSALLKTHAGNLQKSGVYFEQRIRAFIRAKKYQKALELSKDFFADAQVGKGRKLLVQSDFLLASKNYSTARTTCLKGMSLPHDPIYGLQILGKVFMAERNFPAAMKCFDRVQTLAPVNVERICLMAMAEAEQGNPESSGKLMDTVKEMDSKHEMVLETSVTVALVQGDVVGAKKAVGDLPNIMGVVANQNNRAVAMVKSGSLEKSIDIYEKTLEILPEKSRDAHDIVVWNLALAYIKAGNLEKADLILLKVSDGKPSRISRKAVELRKRIATAASTGVPLALKTDDPEASNRAMSLLGTGSLAASGSRAEDEDLLSKMSSDNISVLSLVDFKPGDLGCFQLMPNTEESKDNLAEILNSLPTIKTRWKIAVPPK